MRGMGKERWILAEERKVRPLDYRRQRKQKRRKLKTGMNIQHPMPNAQRPTPTHPHTLLIGKERGFHPPLQNPAPFLKPEPFSFSVQTSNSRQMACGWPEAGGRRERSVRSGAWGEKVIVRVDPQARAEPPSASDRSADCA